MRYVAYALVAMFTMLIQGTVFPSIFHQWMPNLIFVWVVMVTLIRGRRMGMLVAIVGGLVQDIILSNYFGLHLIPYVVVAYVLGFFGRSIYEEQWYLAFSITAGATVVEALVRMVLLELAKEPIQWVPYAWNMVWPVIWVNGALAIGVHLLLWRLMEREETIW